MADQSAFEDAFRLANKACDFEQDATSFKAKGDIPAYQRLRYHARENYTQATEILLAQKSNTFGKTQKVLFEIIQFLIKHIESLTDSTGPRPEIHEQIDPKKGGIFPIFSANLSDAIFLKYR